MAGFLETRLPIHGMYTRDVNHRQCHPGLWRAHDVTFFTLRVAFVLLLIAIPCQIIWGTPAEGPLSLSPEQIAGGIYGSFAIQVVASCLGVRTRVVGLAMFARAIVTIGSLVLMALLIYGMEIRIPGQRLWILPSHGIPHVSVLSIALGGMALCPVAFFDLGKHLDPYTTDAN